MATPEKTQTGLHFSGIHPTAIIDSTTTVAEGVSIGPYVVIGPKCEIAEGCVISPHVVLESHVRLGKGCTVAAGAVLGGLPQDYSFDGVDSYVDIGENTQVREYVTINRATKENEATRVGSGSMIMAYCHVAHDCQVGSNTTLANNVTLAGFVEIGDGVFVSGTILMHQFVKIGRLSFICPFGGTRQDVPPFAMTEGRPQVTVVGINKVGLRRAGFSLEERNNVKKAYHHLWFSKLNLKDAIEKIEAEGLMKDPNIVELVDFVRDSKRGIHTFDLSTEIASTPSVVKENVPV